VRAAPEALAQWQAAASRYAKLVSRAEFRRVLLQAFERAVAGKANRSGAAHESTVA
jgi:hypothetical protein